MTIEDFLALCLFFILLAFISPAEAKQIASAGDGSVTIGLTDELCTLGVVTNLPLRATWLEKGVTIEGCYGTHPYGVIVVYWADKTISIVPISMFRRTIGV